ncbi:PREDICTED: F-box/kelch-repeat protein At4g19930-like [Camelina sativa]|uniref:F-box/kelch-repeat protein At4g19930-like n=1 Tax=Camelina sativa TaxID=90675 RepID=A0ABM1QKU6_CAMSA|nr:PREDICTED: F-box/kelch-repeat protein At4g19930-like [Camelina sativa]
MANEEAGRHHLARESRRKKRKSMVIKIRRRRDMCKSHKLMPEIPFDLVIEILTRLPAKSLMRFKSVSKVWSSLIRSRTFTNRLIRVSSSAPRLYVTLSFLENSHRKTKLLSSSSSPSSDITTTMSSFVIDQDLTIPSMKGYYISHVFRGLMCFVKEPGVQIYNTTTRQLVVLPDIEESNILVEDHMNKKIMYCIGHDPVHDQYKVVCIVARPGEGYGELRTWLTEYWVFILEGNESSRWRKIACPSPHLPITGILNTNECMHYLAWIRVLDPMLVSFDFSSEEISMLQAPEDICWLKSDPIKYYGRVALLDHFDLGREGTMNLWVMEDGEKNMWSKKTLVVHPSQMDIVKSISLRVEDTTRNNEVILVPQNINYTQTGKVIVEPQDTSLLYFFLYDLQKNLMRKVEIKETPYQTTVWDVVGLDNVENFMYL